MLIMSSFFKIMFYEGSVRMEFIVGVVLLGWWIFFYLKFGLICCYGEIEIVYLKIIIIIKIIK